MTAVRAELEANLLLQEDAAAYNTEVAESIFEQGASGVTFIPDGTFPRGIIVTHRLTSAAWTTAQNDVVLSDMPVEEVLLLASVYASQEAYMADVDALLNNVYAAVLRADTSVVRIDGLSQPLLIGGVLRDQARRGARLVEEYRSTLEQL